MKRFALLLMFSASFPQTAPAQAQEEAPPASGPLSPAEVLPLLQSHEKRCGSTSESTYASLAEFNARCTDKTGDDQQQCFRHVLALRLREILTDLMAPPYLVGRDAAEEPKDPRGAIRFLKKELIARAKTEAAVLDRGKQASSTKCDEGYSLVLDDCRGFPALGYELPSLCYKERLERWLGGGGLTEGSHTSARMEKIRLAEREAKEATPPRLPDRETRPRLPDRETRPRLPPASAATSSNAAPASEPAQAPKHH